MIKEKTIEELEKELAQLKKKREDETKRERLLRQIKKEKFAQSKKGKVFNKIADLGDAGLNATKKLLSEKPQKNKGSKKKQKEFDLMKEISHLPA